MLSLDESLRPFYCAAGCSSPAAGAQALRRMHTAVQAAVSHTIYSLTPSCMTPFTFEVVEVTYHNEPKANWSKVGN